MTIAALIVAAGSGSRLGGMPKQYQLLAGQSMLRRSISAFQGHPDIDAVYVVINPAHQSFYDEATQGLNLPPPITGGETRQESVKRGLDAIGQTKYVLIHDAARPFVSHTVIDRVLESLATHKGATPAVRVVDSLRIGETVVTGDLPREQAWRVQTPQGFHYQIIHAAHHAVNRNYTDDVAVAVANGIHVALVEGDENNFKVTTAADWLRADAMIQTSFTPRTGFGYDVHRFGKNADGSSDHIWLCGVSVPHNNGLLGHSDADVGLHALTDAILGALCQGDIGQHFPPNDPQWQGAPSWRFLDHARALVDKTGGSVSHVDVTIICERPKIEPHREAMRARIADILKLDVTRVSVKATTTEGLGFTGRQEGIAAQAVATVMLPS